MGIGIQMNSPKTVGSLQHSPFLGSKFLSGLLTFYLLLKLCSLATYFIIQ
jgi:hypothetical protein